MTGRRLAMILAGLAFALPCLIPAAQSLQFEPAPLPAASAPVAVQAEPTPNASSRPPFVFEPKPSPTPSASPTSPPKVMPEWCSYGPVNFPPHLHGLYTPDNDFGPSVVTPEEVANPKAFIADPTSLPRVLQELCVGYSGFDGEGVQGGNYLLLEAHFSVVDRSDPNAPFNESEWRSGFAARMDRVRWSDATLGIQRAGEYNVMYMEEDRNGDLLVKIDSTWKNPTLVLYLPIERSDGTVEVLVLRLECFFQPMIDDLKHVPPALRKYLH